MPSPPNYPTLKTIWQVFQEDNIKLPRRPDGLVDKKTIIKQKPKHLKQSPCHFGNCKICPKIMLK
jgi:hypothetical protein